MKFKYVPIFALVGLLAILSGMPLSLLSGGSSSTNYAFARYANTNTQTQANSNECTVGSNCGITSPQTQGDGTANSPTNLQISKFNVQEGEQDEGVGGPFDHYRLLEFRLSVSGCGDCVARNFGFQVVEPDNDEDDVGPRMGSFTPSFQHILFITDPKPFVNFKIKITEPTSVRDLVLRSHVFSPDPDDEDCGTIHHFPGHLEWHGTLRKHGDEGPTKCILTFDYR